MGDQISIQCFDGRCRHQVAGHYPSDMRQQWYQYHPGPCQQRSCPYLCFVSAETFCQWNGAVDEREKFPQDTVRISSARKTLLGKAFLGNRICRFQFGSCYGWNDSRLPETSQKSSESSGWQFCSWMTFSHRAQAYSLRLSVSFSWNHDFQSSFHSMGF